MEVEKARALPETFRKQGGIALKTFNNLKGEENRILTKIREYEADNNKVNQKIKDLNALVAEFVRAARGAEGQ